jgi:PRTRC genetic system protein B
MAKNRQPQHTSYLAPEAVASISFLKTRELMFTWQQDDKIQSKLITNEAAFLAFKEGHQQDTGWLPGGVLRAGSNARGEWVVYIARAHMIDIVTDKGEKLRIPIPATLFMGWGSRYYLWALPNKKFDKKLPVYKAPFPNVYDNGRICWGSHKVPKVSANNIERVWQMFFGTAFNEHIATKKCKSYPDNVLDLLRQLSREEATTFPYKELGKADVVSVDLCIDRLLKYGAD